MQSSPTPATSPNSRSFAGLLADLAAPEKKFPPVRDLDGLADDVATLSYEHALRSHARYRPPAVPAAPTPDAAGPHPAAEPPRNEQSSLCADAGRASDDRKNASVTVRVSPAENEQLRQRAAEAGLTVSAYLRSCAFEVETLRSQVKQTLAELRQGSQQAPQQGSREAPRPSFWSRLRPSKAREATS